MTEEQELVKSEYDTSRQIALDRAEGLGIYAELMIEQDMNKKLSDRIKDQETRCEMLAKNFQVESRLVGDLKSEIEHLNEQLKFKEQTVHNNRTTMGALQNALANESYECGFQLDSSWIDRETTRKSRYTNPMSPTSRKSYNRQASRFNTFVTKYNEMGTKDLKNEVAKRMTTNQNMFNSRVSVGFTTDFGESQNKFSSGVLPSGNYERKTGLGIPKGPGQLKGVGRMSQSNTVWANRPNFIVEALGAKLAGQKEELGWSNADTFGDQRETMQFGRMTRGAKGGQSEKLFPTVERVETDHSPEPEFEEKVGSMTVNKSKVKFASGDDENPNSHRSKSRFGSNDLIVIDTHEENLDLEEAEFYDEPELEAQNPFIGQVTPFHSLLAKHMLNSHANYDTPQWAPKSENSVASLNTLKPSSIMAGLALTQIVSDFTPYKKMVDERVELNMKLLDLESELKDANEARDMNITAVMEKSELEGKKMIFMKAQGALKSINGRINQILDTTPDTSPKKPKLDPLHNMQSFQTREFAEDVLGEQIDHLKGKLEKLELHTRGLQSHSDEISLVLEKKESELLGLESANSEINAKLDVLEVSKVLDQNLVLELRELLESKEKSIEKFELSQKTSESEKRALNDILEGSFADKGRLAEQVIDLGSEIEKREKIIAGLKLRVDGLGKGNAELETFVSQIKKELKDSAEAQESLAKKGDGLASELEKSQKLIEAKDTDLKSAAEKLAAAQNLTDQGKLALESKISEHQTAIDAALEKFDSQNKKLELINENCLD